MPKLNNKWILKSFGAATFFGIADFTLGSVSDEGPWAPAIVGVIPALFLIFYRLFEVSMSKKSHGSVFMQNSNWLTADRKSINTRYLIYLSKLCAPSIVVMWIIVYGFQFAFRGGINSGIVSSLFSLASFYISILFYFTFSEKVSWFEGIGIVVMFLAVIFLSLENASKPTYDELTGENPRLFAFLAIVLGIIAPMTFAVKAYFIRMSEQYNYDAWTVAVDNYSVEFIIYGAMIFFYLGYKSDDFTWQKFIVGNIAGLCILGGKFCAFYAYKEGIGGVVNSLLSLQIIIHVFLNWIAYSQALTVYQFLGVGLGLASTVIATLGDLIWQKLFGNPKTSQDDSMRIDVQKVIEQQETEVAALISSKKHQINDDDDEIIN